MKAILFLMFCPFFKVLFFLFIFALTFHKCQIVKKAFLFFFWPFSKCAFLSCVFWFRFRVKFLGCSWFCVISLGAGRRAALFSVGLFVCVFCLCFLFFSCFFGFLFGSGCWAPCCSSFRRREHFFFCAFLFVISFKVGPLFCVLFFGSGCWAPCCSFFRRAFCVRFCLCFLFFSGCCCCCCCCVVVCVVVCVVCVFKIVGGCLQDFWASPPASPLHPRRTAFPLEPPKISLLFFSLSRRIFHSFFSL